MVNAENPESTEKQDLDPADPESQHRHDSLPETFGLSGERSPIFASPCLPSGKDLSRNEEPACPGVFTEPSGVEGLGSATGLAIVPHDAEHLSNLGEADLKDCTPTSQPVATAPPDLGVEMPVIAIAGRQVQTAAPALPSPTTQNKNDLAVAGLNEVGKNVQRSPNGADLLSQHLPRCVPTTPADLEILR
eukprot:GHVT01093946.1.p2 GENE.GHVT01093946.1~~GHVT01093946.1.p2  ORF type:complete len:190 (+),score=26.38 GHVT01093946.1:142-711(+)